MDTVDNGDECVAIILERSQLFSNYGLLDLTVHRLNNRSGHSASVCVGQNLNTSKQTIDVFLYHDQEIIGVPATVTQIHGKSMILLSLQSI